MELRPDGKLYLTDGSASIAIGSVTEQSNASSSVLAGDVNTDHRKEMQ
jgi:hypothetical protein